MFLWAECCEAGVLIMAPCISQAPRQAFWQPFLLRLSTQFPQTLRVGSLQKERQVQVHVLVPS